MAITDGVIVTSASCGSKAISLRGVAGTMLARDSITVRYKGSYVVNR